MKIISIVGARPQFIKLATLSNELRKFHEEIIVHTGQHFDKKMSDLFFDELGIPKPDINLSINKGSHGEQSGKMLIEIERVLFNNKPDLVIVFGDTNSTIAGSLAAAKLGITIVHIEAGLRSFNKEMPEEINRIVTDHVSDYLFAPTKTAIYNLKNEGLHKKSFLTGDIMVDSHRMALLKSKNNYILKKHNLIKKNYFLLTLHRPYNVDNPQILASIINELGKLNNKVVFPVHPRTKLMISNNSIFIPDNIRIIDPVGYLDFVNLQANSLKIITDSGGIQKEAYILKKPCITLRSETEWIETVETGWNLLINPQKRNNYYKDIEIFFPHGEYKKLFGENVAIKMVEIINSEISLK